MDFSGLQTIPGPKGFDSGCYNSVDWNTGLDYWTDIFCVNSSNKPIHTIKTTMYTPHLVATISTKTQL